LATASRYRFLKLIDRINDKAGMPSDATDISLRNRRRDYFGIASPLALVTFPNCRRMIMKTFISALVAISVLTGVAATSAKADADYPKFGTQAWWDQQQAEQH
jgi:hypothetical protein